MSDEVLIEEWDRFLNWWVVLQPTDVVEIQLYRALEVLRGIRAAPVPQQLGFVPRAMITFDHFQSTWVNDHDQAQYRLETVAPMAKLLRVHGREQDARCLEAAWVLRQLVHHG